MKLHLSTVFCTVLLATCVAADMTDKKMEQVEESTESPLADMKHMAEANLATAAERTPVKAAEEVKKPEQQELPSSQRHTVADFIIHPLIAFKPRNPEDETAAGKQAESSTTASPWQLFGFNTGQGLGSSVQSIAGSVTGWLNDRIQLPGLVDSPIRGSSTTTTSTTTTTHRPDVVVRVQHKATTRRPQLISIDPQRRRPNFNYNNNNNNFNSAEFDDDDFDDDDREEDDDDEHEEEHDEEHEEEHDEEHEEEPEHDDDSGEEHDDDDSNNNREHDEEEEEPNGSQEDNDSAHDDDEEEKPQKPQRKNNRRKPIRSQQHRREPQQNTSSNIRRRTGSSSPQRLQSEYPPNRRRPAEAEVQYDDEEQLDNNFLFFGSHPSTKRSQSQANFIQRGQQSIINQIRQLTRGHTPAEISTIMRNPPQDTKRHRQQATLFVNRNGQTIYLAPELYDDTMPQLAVTPSKRTRPGQYPQPPLTVPMKRKGQPTQYITIPWSQLGISPPNRMVTVTEGIQSQPLILNIPQSAINAMQTPSPTKKRRRPVITSEAVPLLAEASLMEVFQPPKIPPSRGSPPSQVHNVGSTGGGASVVISTKPKPQPVVLPQRIRPGTIVEKAPAMADEKPNHSDETAAELPMPEGGDQLRAGESEYILVGEDDEPGLTRQVTPVMGDARYVHVGDGKPFYEMFRSKGRYGLRKGRHAFEQPENVAAVRTAPHYIPVQIVNEDTDPLVGEDPNKPITVEEPASSTVDEPQMLRTIEDPQMPEIAESSSDPLVAKVDESSVPQVPDTVEQMDLPKTVVQLSQPVISAEGAPKVTAEVIPQMTKIVATDASVS